MCGRTSLAAEVGVLGNRFGATPAEGVTIQPRYNIAPREDLVAITNEEPEEMDYLEWGLLPHWADDPDDVPSGMIESSVDDRNSSGEVLCNLAQEVHVVLAHRLVLRSR